MPKSIFITRPIPANAIQALRDKGYEVTINESDKVPSEHKLEHFLKKKPYDAVVTLLTDPINAEIFDAAPSVKLYANYASGFDNIDLVEAKKRGITVTNAPAEASTEAVAEHTIALMLSLALRIVEADAYVRRGKYKGWSAMNFIGTDLAGKTLGLIGAGRIGERVAILAKAFDMKVAYYDVKKNDRLEQAGVSFKEKIEDVLKDADVISLHVPLLPSTRHLINESHLRMMKRTSFIVNTSRGPIINEADLEKALREGIIRGAALDVFESEPKIARSLRKLPNVVLTPHIGSASERARNEMADIVAANVIDFFEGRIPKNIL